MKPATEETSALRRMKREIKEMPGERGESKSDTTTEETTGASEEHPTKSEMDIIGKAASDLARRLEQQRQARSRRAVYREEKARAVSANPRYKGTEYARAYGGVPDEVIINDDLMLSAAIDEAIAKVECTRSLAQRDQQEIEQLKVETRMLISKLLAA